MTRGPVTTPEIGRLLKRPRRRLRVPRRAGESRPAPPRQPGPGRLPDQYPAYPRTRKAEPGGVAVARPPGSALRLPKTSSELVTAALHGSLACSPPHRSAGPTAPRLRDRRRRRGQRGNRARGAATRRSRRRRRRSPGGQPGRRAVLRLAGAVLPPGVSVVDRRHETPPRAARRTHSGDGEAAGLRDQATSLSVAQTARRDAGRGGMRRPDLAQAGHHPAQRIAVVGHWSGPAPTLLARG